MAVTCFVALRDVPRPSPACARSVTGPRAPSIRNELSAPTFVVAKNASAPFAMTVVWPFHPSGRPLTMP